MYNLMGCEFTVVNAKGHKQDDDIIDFANQVMSDESTKDNEFVTIIYGEGDSVAKSELDYTHYKDSDGQLLKFSGNKSSDHQYIENGRTKTVITNENGDETVTYFAHDGVKLKNSYAEAKTKELPDGYKIKTSPDGKEQWFFTPEGKQISKNEFMQRGL